MDLNLSDQTDYVFKSANPILDVAADEKEAVWIPYEPRTVNRFLILDLSTKQFWVALGSLPSAHGGGVGIRGILHRAMVTECHRLVREDQWEHDAPG